MPRRSVGRDGFPIAPAKTSGQAGVHPAGLLPHLVQAQRCNEGSTRRHFLHRRSLRESLSFGRGDSNRTLGKYKASADVRHGKRSAQNAAQERAYPRLRAPYNSEMADSIACSCVTCPKCWTWVVVGPQTEGAGNTRNPVRDRQPHGNGVSALAVSPREKGCSLRCASPLAH